MTSSCHPLISFFWSLGVANPSLTSQVDTIKTMKSTKRSLWRHEMATFTSSFRRSCIGTLVHIASMLASHSLAVHGDYVSLIATCIPLLVLITILQRLQIIRVSSSSFTSIAACSDTTMGSMNAWQLFSFGSIWLLVIHVKLPNLVLWSS